LPAIALGADKKPDDIMNDKPRDPKESLFSHGGYAITFGYGALIGIATLIAFLDQADGAKASWSIAYLAHISVKDSRAFNESRRSPVDGLLRLSASASSSICSA
jgi:Ca2+-transporting ATPase